MALRKLREFTDPTDARTARQLTRQLGELEENAAAETAAIRLEHLPNLIAKDDSTRDDGVILACGESLGVDTTSGSLSVVLEAPGPKSAGKLAAIFKRVASNTVTVRPDGGALINGATSLAITARGLTLILSDGKAYWA
jgi:hypothetical protein